MPNLPPLTSEQQFAELLAAPYEQANFQLCLAAADGDSSVPEFEKVQLSENAAAQFSLIVTRQMQLVLNRATRGNLRLLKKSK